MRSRFPMGSEQVETDRQRGLLKANQAPTRGGGYATCGPGRTFTPSHLLTGCQEGQACKNVFVKPLNSVRHIVGAQQVAVSFISP